MFKIKLFTRKRQHINQSRTPVDQAVDTFLDGLVKQQYFNMDAARDAIAIARERQIDRPVEIWVIYHQSIAHYV